MNFKIFSQQLVFSASLHYLNSQIIRTKHPDISLLPPTVWAAISIVMYNICPISEASIVRSFSEEAFLTETHWRTDGVPTGIAS